MLGSWWHKPPFIALTTCALLLFCIDHFFIFMDIFSLLKMEQEVPGCLQSGQQCFVQLTLEIAFITVQQMPSK
jgi:hypothetical protein